MTKISDAYAPPHGKKHKLRIVLTMFIGLAIVTIFIIAMSRVARDMSQYKRIGEAVLNYEQQ